MIINNMSGINTYGIQLDDSDISKKVHRGRVGGLWDELGTLQFEFLKLQGLKPEHRLLDLGCGCMRGGVKFIDYLNVTNYTGIDINASLLKAGSAEITEHALTGKQACLVQSDSFGSDKHIGLFDFAISVSLFTHLPSSYIQQALQTVKSKLVNDGLYFATFFVVDDLNALYVPTVQLPGDVTTHAHKDPFHFNPHLIEFISEQVGLKCTYIGNWEHPRNQKMFKFEHK